MQKIFRKIHLWLSIPIGIIITLICFSGAMLVFEPEITRSAKKEIYYVKDVKKTALPIGDLMESVKATLPDSVSITGVTVFADKERTYQVNLSKPRRASLFVDQYTGQITGKYERLGFFSTMFKLHRWLLDSANPHGEEIKVGKLLVGISTLMLVIVLITGIVIWVPRVVKTSVLRSLSISFTKGWPVFWKGLHVAGGMYALILILAMALTGMTWSFDWYRTAFYAVCGVEHTPRNFGQPSPAMADKSEFHIDAEHGGKGLHNGEGRRGRNGGGGRRHSEFGRWQEVYEKLSVSNPAASQITIGPETASVTLDNLGNTRASDRYQFNRRSGEISLTNAYFDTPEADKLRGWIYAIHTGSLGGITTRILWFLGALLGASLPLTGYYIWIRHLRNKKKKNSKSNVV